MAYSNKSLIYIKIHHSECSIIHVRLLRSSPIILRDIHWNIRLFHKFEVSTSWNSEHVKCIRRGKRLLIQDLPEYYVYALACTAYTCPYTRCRAVELCWKLVDESARETLDLCYNIFGVATCWVLKKLIFSKEIWIYIFLFIYYVLERILTNSKLSISNMLQLIRTMESYWRMYNNIF